MTMSRDSQLADFSREIEDMLDDAGKCPDTPEVLLPPEECHQQLFQLRDQARGLLDRLQQSMGIYYHLCRVVDGQFPPPLVFLELHSLELENGLPLRLQLSLGNEEVQHPGGMTVQILGQAASAYVESWTGLKDVTDRAVKVCAQLVKHIVAAQADPVTTGG
jgi:hypothetical protein